MCPLQVTPETLQRKRRKAAIKKARYEKSKAEAAEYHKLLMQVRPSEVLTDVEACGLMLDVCENAAQCILILLCGQQRGVIGKLCLQTFHWSMIQAGTIEGCESRFSHATKP
jgi:hypothetical protein